MSERSVLVLGGGAAGIMAAYRAGQLGAKVTILEKTKQLGTKILISGGGKCNVAHDGPLEDVLRAFRKNETLFIRPACYQLPNRSIIRMMTDRGLEVVTRSDGRVFPAHQTAKDVMAILKQYLADANVHVQYHSPVTGIELEQGRVTGVWTGPPAPVHSGYQASETQKTQFWPADRVVLCTGGSSYPNCGTTGDGWRWAREIGHSIVPVRAALAPIYLDLSPARSELSGVALRDVTVKARVPGREIARWKGDLLFTHQGLSGPTILGISREVAEQSESVRITVDLCDGLRPEEVQSRLLAAPSGVRLGRWLHELLPERMAKEFCRDHGLESDALLNQLDRKSRNRLAEGLKAWDLGVVRVVPLEKGECVAGGISLDEVDPKTMESRKVAGLYLAGEVLDIAGPVGGYNLQAAFATGWLAGESAATR